jgi:rod shape determining protein RodA
MRRLSSFRDFDWMLLTLVLLLSIISVIEIKSATLHTKFHGFDHKQIGFLLVGMGLMFLISVIDYHVLLEIAPWAYGISLAFLVAVILVGTKVLGARRWISLGGGVHFQPSEWVKLILILVVARYFWGLAGRELNWPDLGTALTYLPVLIAGLFLGGIRVKQVAILLLGLTVIAGGAWLSGKRLKPYQMKRVTSFIDPASDPKGAGYQLLQSKIAVGSGGLWGKGTNRGTQTQGDFLPIPYTDFIFAAFCEEHGFVGGVGILLLYFIILTRLIQNAQQASDMPGTFIVMGVVAVILFQIVVNIGMVLGLMPVTGIPLPLMSYGGSSILFTFLALGIVMNIRMRRFVN